MKAPLMRSAGLKPGKTKQGASMNKALKRHHERIARQESVELAIVITASIAASSVFIGFGLISAVMGV